MKLVEEMSDAEYSLWLRCARANLPPQAGRIVVAWAVLYTISRWTWWPLLAHPLSRVLRAVHRPTTDADMALSSIVYGVVVVLVVLALGVWPIEWHR